MKKKVDGRNEDPVVTREYKRSNGQRDQVSILGPGRIPGHGKPERIIRVSSKGSVVIVSITEAGDRC
jgi:hypothetical protein